VLMAAVWTGLTRVVLVLQYHMDAFSLDFVRDICPVVYSNSAVNSIAPKPGTMPSSQHM
jgi:hypothetical protein